MNESVTDVKAVNLPDDFVEQILKQYRRITWECKTAKDIGNSYKISMDFLPLLKDVFFQDNELRSSNNISLEYVLLTQIKKIMDTGLKKIKRISR